MGKKYEKVESFKYLGAMITSLNDIETEIKSKIAVGNKCYYTLGTILKRISIFQSIKTRLYKTIIRPVVTYGAETWTVTSKWCSVPHSGFPGSDPSGDDELGRVGLVV